MNLGEKFMEWTFDNIFPWLAGSAIVFVVILIVLAPFAIYAEYKAEKFSLRKDEWNCTASVERASTTYVQSGNVLLPITSYNKQCTQWSAKP